MIPVSCVSQHTEDEPDPGYDAPMMTKLLAPFLGLTLSGLLAICLVPEESSAPLMFSLLVSLVLMLLTVVLGGSQLETPVPRPRRRRLYPSQH